MNLFLILVYGVFHDIQIKLSFFRLFIVCHPSPPPIYALKDVFGRFGNLIDIYMLNGKTFGYAKYSSKESADKAIAVSNEVELLLSVQYAFVIAV